MQKAVFAQKVILVLLVIAALAALAVPVTWTLDRVYGQDVILLATLNDDVGQEAARYFADLDALDGDARREAVAGIYGTSGGLNTDRVLVFDETRLIVPDEDPEMRLLAAGSADAEAYPIQTRSVRYVADRVSLAALLAIALLLLIRFGLVKRRSANA